MKYILLILGLGTILTACSHQNSMRANTTAMTPVDLKRYMGTWYEIARLPNSFEEGLSKVTAHYSLMENGRVLIVNKGYHHDGRESSITGEAYVPNPHMSGHLRLSFVYPYRWFYSSYNILYVNEDYSLALVSGRHSDYLWLLARQPSISKEELELLLRLAQERGFSTDRLIFPTQDK